MKAFLLFFALLSLVITQTINENELRGCQIKEKEGRCCWLNRNGCCRPPKPNQMCTMAFKYCCKTKTFNEETQQYVYSYN